MGVGGTLFGFTLHKEGIGGMQELAGGKRRVRFSLGVVLFFIISALVWLLSLWVVSEIVLKGTGTQIERKPEAWEIISVGLIYVALPIGIGIYGIKHGRNARVAETKPGPEPAYKGQPGVKRAVVFAIVALVVPGMFGFTGLVSDLAPGETYAVRLLMAGLLFLIWGLVCGYFNPRLWPVAGVVVWGGFFLPPVLISSLGVALGGGYLGLVLRRSSVIPRLFRRKQCQWFMKGGNQ